MTRWLLLCALCTVAAAASSSRSRARRGLQYELGAHRKRNASRESRHPAHLREFITKRQLIVLRAVGVLDSCKLRMVNRFIARAKGYADVLVSVDLTPVPAAVGLEGIRRARRSLHPVPVLPNTAADSLRAFPGVQWPFPCEYPSITQHAANTPLHKGPCRYGPARHVYHPNGTRTRARGFLRGWRLQIERRYAKLPGWNMTQAVNYISHDPALILVQRWLTVLHRDGVISRLPLFYWNIEWDAGFTGHLSAFLSFYELRIKRGLLDFASVHSHYSQDRLDTRYAWMVNQKWIERFPVPYMKWEHVDGYSSGFLRRLARLMESGAIASSEFAAMTLCKAEGCKFADLAKDGWVPEDHTCYLESRMCNTTVVLDCLTPGSQRRCHNEYDGRYSNKWLHKVGDWCAIYPKNR